MTRIVHNQLITVNRLPRSILQYKKQSINYNDNNNIVMTIMWSLKCTKSVM